MERNNGFTLLELLVSMAIGLTLLSTLMTFWLALSRNTHQEIIKLGLAQDDVEVAEYLRSTLGKAIYAPNCLNPEWLIYEESDQNTLSNLLFRNRGVVIHKSIIESSNDIAMQNAATQFPDLFLGNYRLRTLEGSDLLEILYLTPLSVVSGQIINTEDIRGARAGSILVTDCRTYLLGEYERKGDDYFLGSQFSRNVDLHLYDDRYHLYYKINRLLIYVSYEQGVYFLIYNFMDGSNFIRFPSVQGLTVDFELDDHNLLNVQLLLSSGKTGVSIERQIYVRLLNL